MKPSHLLFATLLAASASAFAQAGPTDHAPHPPTDASAASPADAALAEGEVRKVDKDAGKLTLRHGPIASLEMPAMTMVFRVAAPEMLDELKQGDKVRFSADRVNGALTVTSLKSVK